ncbi:hypothetical protein [Vitiosangium sp. GDMCC 1.1324]|uniref:hypothetical protein n=1 Tax=Vitiosangium sp. (strain GDMCC 1.1324) TaxID=2138576 RepID=UPI0011B3D6DA|nr:hypothetical protein [Vitiosangium sp. GDMCC 1.1324]
MAKHQLIISKDISRNYPVRSEAGELKETRTLVVNWDGTWKPNDRPDKYLVVAPGDELEIVLAAEKDEGSSLWLYNRVRPLPSLLLPLPEDQRQGGVERVDIKSGSVILEVNRAIARDAGESRYDLRISAMGEIPMPIVGQGQPGTLTATRP